MVSRAIGAGRRRPASVLFAGLSETDLIDVLADARTIQVGARSRLCIEGEPASRLFVLCEGNAKFYRLSPEGEELLLYWLAPGDSFGLGAMLQQSPPYLGTAESVSACDLLMLDGRDVQKAARAHPQLAINALAVALKYLSKYSRRHSRLLSQTATQRIAGVLIDLGRRVGQISPEGVDVQISNHQLGSLADTSPFTASRVLNVWQDEGIVTKRRQAVCIHSPEGLLAN